MSDPRDHKDKQLSRLYREGAWPEASSQIDRALRRSERARQSVARRWGPPIVLAAMVAIGSSTALMYRDQPQAVPPPPNPDKAPAAPSRQAAPAAETKLETKAPERKPAPEREPAPKPVATPRGFTSTMDAAEVERLDRLERALAEKSPATQQPREKQALSTPPPVHASAAPQAAPKPADKPAPALKKEAPPRAEPARPASAPQQAIQAAPVSPALPAPAAPAPSTAAISAGAAATDTPGASQRSPQAWTEDIRKLMAEGRYEEAGGEIVRLKDRYPDYALPDDLR